MATTLRTSEREEASLRVLQARSWYYTLVGHAAFLIDGESPLLAWANWERACSLRDRTTEAVLHLQESVGGRTVPSPRLSIWRRLLVPLRPVDIQRWSPSKETSGLGWWSSGRGSRESLRRLSMLPPNDQGVLGLFSGRLAIADRVSDVHVHDLCVLLLVLSTSRLDWDACGEIQRARS